MRTFVSMLLPVIALAGCQGGLLSDSMKGSGQLAAEDAAYCQYAGLTPGTQAYANCMIYKDQVREIRHAEARSDLREGLHDLSVATQPVYSPPPAPPRVTNCTTRRNGPYLDTTCY